MDDFSILANPEEAFFEHGYADGYAHGRIHGLIEGRAAGKEKGIELWEEVGYYRGFALLWQAAHSGATSSRSSHHITNLLNAIDRFPMTNPQPIALETPSTASDEIDVSKLLSQIRSRYRALCSVLSVPPRLRPLSTGEDVADNLDDALKPPSVSTGSVWAIDNPKAKPAPLEL